MAATYPKETMEQILETMEAMDRLAGRSETLPSLRPPLIRQEGTSRFIK